MAAASNKSVWRQRKAGICKTSTYFAAISASCAVCISVVVGTLNFSPTFLINSNAFSSPMPVNDLAAVRFALRYDALKMYGISKFLQMPETFSATSITNSSPSTAHGPAIKKKLFRL